MARHRTYREIVADLDEIVENVEHARPVHPLRALISQHFYLDGWVTSEGGLSLAMMTGLLLVPFIFSLFFFPVRGLIGLGVVLIAIVVLYQGFAIWRRRRARLAAPSRRGRRPLRRRRARRCRTARARAG